MDLLGIAGGFVREQAAVARCLEVDKERDRRLGPLTHVLEAFRGGELLIDEIMRPIGTALRERSGGTWLWGFKNEDERAFPERLAAAASRAPELDLNGVLRSLLKDADSVSDEERVNRLLAFADFVADLDSRGQEGDPRLGVGPSANFLTLCWHVLGQAREPIFHFETNKAIKALSEESSDPTLKGRDLEGRFRAFYAAARRLAPALAGAPSPMRAGWAFEHALEWALERIGALSQSASTEEPASTNLWKPRPRAELKGRPPSGRLPAVSEKPRPSITIQPPRRPSSDEKPVEKPVEKEDDDDRAKTERIFAIGKAKTIIAEEPKPEPRKEEPPPPDPRTHVTPRPLPRIAAKKSGAVATAEEPRAEEKPSEKTSAPAPVSVSAPVPAAEKVLEPVLADGKAQTAPMKRLSTDSSGELLTAALGELIGEIATAEAEPEVPAAEPASDTWRSERLAHLAYSEKLVGEALEALKTRGRVLLTGVFASGKTYLARRIALHVAGRDERLAIVRMHPSLGYDELVENRRHDGTIERGIVRELCERAKKDRDARFVLLLDDVDQGDTVRALGELAGALSERGVEVQLGRSREKVAFPKNLYVIATARSAPKDLVGRFPCVEVEPDPEALRRFLARTNSALEWAADILREANSRLIRERGPQARIGHALLMDAELDLPRLEGLWRREVLPYVRSLGLDAKEFELSALRH